MSARICSVPGCLNPTKARGWCMAHYARWKRTGDPQSPVRRRSGPPPSIVDGKVPLLHGGYALIDPEDAPMAAGYYWVENKGYAVGSREGVQVLLHRLIRPDIEGDIDHENLNRLDCRRSNLRPADAQLNSANKAKLANSRQPYKGVYGEPHGRWRARIQVNDQRIHLGTFDTPEQAAAAYDAAAIEHFGQYAFTNAEGASA